MEGRLKEEGKTPKAKIEQQGNIVTCQKKKTTNSLKMEDEDCVVIKKTKKRSA